MGVESVVERVCGKMREMSLAFSRKPIVIGGGAMEYYGIRKAGFDIDLVIRDEDYQRLAMEHPGERKDIYGDLGVVLWPFEIWRCINLLDYDFYLEGAQEWGGLFVVSFDRLLLMRAMARDKEKYNTDLNLMIRHIYDTRCNAEYLRNANAHAASYEKKGGVVFAGEYED